jgi:hypothetical protein
MTPRFGIDTSILLRLATGDPADLYAHCVERLTALIESDGAEVFASNQVIGEAYIALQHHYGVTKAEAREGLANLLQSGLVAPGNGQHILTDPRRRGRLRPPGPPRRRRLPARGPADTHPGPRDGQAARCALALTLRHP